MIAFRDGRWEFTGGPAEDRLTARAAAFVPGWNPAEQGPGRAILAVAARFAGIVEDRLARAPDNAKMAFLDAIGVTPVPARAARGPVVIELTPGALHGHAPPGTRLGAQPPGGGDPIPFETTDGIALAASRLIEVKAALPGDRYADHTAAVLGGRPFTLFEAPRPVPRELYVGHDRLFALTPGAVVELQVELAAGSGPLPAGAAVDWQYWDGEAWVGFVPWPPSAAANRDEFSLDGTVRSGRDVPLARSGTILLRAGERSAAPTAVRGITAYWVRGLLRMPPAGADAPPGRTAVPSDGDRPQIDRLRARVRQSVGGFRVLSRAERVIGALTHQPALPATTAPVRTAGGEGERSRNIKVGREIRLRLVDDSGGPLDVRPKAGQRYFVYDLRNKHTEVPLSNAPDGVFAVALDNPDEPLLRISTDKLTVDGRPADTHARPTTWDVPSITGLLTDRSYDIDLARGGRLPEVAFANGLKADPSSTFLPFGPLPLPGAAFHFASAEVAGKPGARVTVFTEVDPPDPDKAPDPLPAVAWEYWNGLVWAPLPQPDATPEVLSFRQSGDVRFTVPSNMAAKLEFGQEKPWVRVRLVSGGYLAPKGGVTQVPDPKDDTKTKPVSFPKVFPPAVQRFRIGYEYESPPEPPTACLSFDEFAWTDVTGRVGIGGRPFTPFAAPADTRPTLYLGFTRPLPLDTVSLYLDVVSSAAGPGPAWEYSDGAAWRPLQLAADTTDGLRTPGYVRFLWPGMARPDSDPTAAAGYAVADGKPTVTLFDARGAARYRPGDAVAVMQDDASELAAVEAVEGAGVVLDAPLAGKFTTPLFGFAPPARFGAPRYWVRAVWPDGGAPRPTDPDRVAVRGVYLNATGAEQVRTQADERLGGTTGVGGEVFDFARQPVLDGEQVWVLELSGGRAEAEWPALRDELTAAGKDADRCVSIDRDPRTRKATAAWVRWDGVPTFAGSGPGDRHYTVERVRGRLQFGDGRAGLIPPPLPNNLKATYRAGGGKGGNVPAFALTALLGPVAGVQRVYNPVPLGGGADGELAAAGDPQADRRTGADRAILDRGPQLIRHRHRAVTAADYEQLARLASPGVAAARAATPERTGGVVRAGTVRVVVVPHADAADPEPTPDPALVERVRAYIQARAPAGVRVEVAAPQFLPIGVEAVLVPREEADAGRLTREAKAVVAAFLHAVVGGPDGRGWAFGRSVYRSDVVAALHHRLADLLAYPQDVRLLVGGVAQAEQADVPGDRLPSAGTIRVVLAAGGEVRP